MTRLLLVTLLLAPALRAATYIVPSDAELIQGSDEIVVATGVASLSERNGRGGIVTRYTLRVEETLKGQSAAGAYIMLTELGGVLGDRSRIVAGSPRYEPGVRYLVFTSTNRDLEPTTNGMSLGQFHLEGGLALRSDILGFDRNLESHVEPLRDAQLFSQYIRGVVAQRPGQATYFVARGPSAASQSAESEAMLPYSRTSYLLETGGIGYRWKNPSVDWVRNGTQPGSDGAAAVVKGLAQWNGTDSAIDYHDAGVDPLAVAGLNPDDGRNGVLFNDPDDEIADNSGVVGIGGVSGGDTYQFEGETFYEVKEGDVVVANRTFTQSCLDTIITHELGHTLGIRHSGAPPPGTVCDATAQCTSDAIMNSSISCGWNGLLRGWDENAAAIVYGDGVECAPPVIYRHPAPITVRRGQLIRLSVDAGGTAPLRYEWFEGERGVTTKPVGNGWVELVIVTGRQESTRFWVRVSNDCESVDSQAATVTIPVRRRSARH